MIAQARIRYETVLVPKPGKYVIYTGEHNPGEVYQIYKTWTGDTYCDLINKELIYCREILSVPLGEMIVPYAEIEIETAESELKREGLVKKYRLARIPIAPEDYKFIYDNKLGGRKVDVICDSNDYGIKEDQLCNIYMPTIDFKGIPAEFHATLRDILDQATADAFYLGTVSKSTDEFYSWFQEKFKNLQ